MRWIAANIVPGLEEASSPLLAGKFSSLNCIAT
jgi:hypothetical protein